MSDDSNTAGDQPADATPAAAADSSGDQKDQTPQIPDGMVLISQDKLNSISTGGNKNIRQKLQQAEAKANAYEQLRGQVSSFLDGGLEGIEGVESLDEFRDAAAATINQFKSDQEKLADENAKTAKELKDAQERASTAELKFTNSTIDRAITDDAANKAYSPQALSLIRMHLRQFAQMKEDDSVVFNMQVADEDGNVSDKALTAKQAVELMEADVDNFGPLFKSGVNGGAGNDGDGKKVSKGKVVNRDGTINVSMEDFMKMEDPNQLGEMVQASFQ